ncbi:ArsR/SmtB family transcription factor [Demequina sp.]|uniref:ArsR/SmtB family transcription factor n=1 Tax=Demequina sp. TaxID=2050685 RepID=UPI003D1096EA
MSEAEGPERIIDAASLKALAHPLRVDLFDRLIMFGPATASQLAEALGESSGATSYHLRQLARHHFIEEDPDRGNAKERYWRVPKGGVTMNPTDFEEGSAEAEAGTLVVRQMVEQRYRHVDAFLRRGQREMGSEWVAASALMSARTTLTAQELATVTEEIAGAIDAALDRYRDREDPEGARPVVLHFNAFPVIGAPTHPEES